MGYRSSGSFEKLCKNILYIGAKFYVTDKFSAYNTISKDKHLIRKSHTYTVERMNCTLRHYLARFARKTYCWSKTLNMIDNSVILFLYRDLISSLHF